jgi:hypothetical protein
MTTSVKVFPTKATALNVRHPIAGAAKLEGADWPYDVFTCSRLADGSFTDDPKKAFKPDKFEAFEGAMLRNVAAAAAPASAAVADAAKPK